MTVQVENSRILQLCETGIMVVRCWLIRVRGCRFAYTDSPTHAVCIQIEHKKKGDGA